MKVENLVPSAYYKESRDFAYVGRLYEAMLNYMKVSADMVKVDNTSENLPSDLIELFALAVGFETRHKYLNKDLVAICNSFSELLKNKGKKTCVENCVTILLNSQNISKKSKVIADPNDSHHYFIYVPSNIKDLVLLDDLFEYILPVGITYTFRYRNADDFNITTNLEGSQSVEVYTNLNNLLFGQVATESNTQTELFTVLTSQPSDWATKYNTYYVWVDLHNRYELNTSSTWDTTKTYAKFNEQSSVPYGTVA